MPAALQTISVLRYAFQCLPVTGQPKATSKTKLRQILSKLRSRLRNDTAMKNVTILPDLLLAFMKIGLFTFGGGYAMIAMMEHDIVEKKRWITHDDLMNITVIAESTPGPIAVNCATFVGYRQAGLIGSLFSTFGLVFPAFAVMFLISVFLDDFLQLTIVSHAFQGIKTAVGIVIFGAGFGMLKKMQKKKLPLTIMACSFAAMLAINFFSLDLSSVGLLLIAGSASLILFVIRKALRSAQSKAGR